MSCYTGEHKVKMDNCLSCHCLQKWLQKVFGFIFLFPHTHLSLKGNKPNHKCFPYSVNDKTEKIDWENKISTTRMFKMVTEKKSKPLIFMFAIRHYNSIHI